MEVQLSVQSILAYYSAVLSTALAVITVIKFLRERPRIPVTAIPKTKPSAEGEDTHGILVRVRRGDDELWEEADIEIRVSNSGAQACQITDIFIETKEAVQQVLPGDPPVVLDPNTSCYVRVQSEPIQSLLAGMKNVASVSTMMRTIDKH
jgi:hypothetical protein